MQRTWVKFSIWRRKKSFPLFVTVGSVLLPSGSKLETLGVSRWQRGAPYCLSSETWFREGRVYVCVCGWRVWHTRALHLSQLTLRICLCGTSPPRPIHQPGPNTPCATVDMGLTTWHWQRWVRPVAEWRLGRKEMDWPVIDIQFELLQIFPFSGKMRTSLSAHAVGQVRAIFQSTQLWSKVYLWVVSVHCCRSENKQWPCP